MHRDIYQLSIARPVKRKNEEPKKSDDVKKIRAVNQCAPRLPPKRSKEGVFSAGYASSFLIICVNQAVQLCMGHAYFPLPKLFEIEQRRFRNFGCPAVLAMQSSLPSGTGTCKSFNAAKVRVERAWICTWDPV